MISNHLTKFRELNKNLSPLQIILQIQKFKNFIKLFHQASNPEFICNTSIIFSKYDYRDKGPALKYLQEKALKALNDIGFFDPSRHRNSLLQM